MNKYAYIVAGIALGIALVLSCGDDRLAPADAASCECAPAEAPIPSRVIESIKIHMLPPSSDRNGRSGNSVLCPDGSILLSGGCTAGTGQVPDIVIEQSSPFVLADRAPGSTRDGWDCSWRNNTNQPVQVRIVARCLMASP